MALKHYLSEEEQARMATLIEEYTSAFCRILETFERATRGRVLEPQEQQEMLALTAMRSMLESGSFERMILGNPEQAREMSEAGTAHILNAAQEDHVNRQKANYLAEVGKAPTGPKLN